MIRKFGLRDFKGHRDTELELGRFTLLVGDNASGKTSVLDALALHASVISHPLAAVVQNTPLEDLVRRGSGERATLMASGLHARPGATADRAPGPVEPWNTKLELRTPADAARQPDHRLLELSGRSGNVTLHVKVTQHPDAQPAVEQWTPALAAIGTAGFYHLQARAIAAAAYSDVPDVRIEPDGTNTAVALAAMKLDDDEAFQRIEDGLRKVVPSVERVRIRRAVVEHPSGKTDVVGSQLYFDFRGAVDVPGHGASHGTLIVLALLTILHGPHRPNLILLDDFDHALHPRAQMELVRMIKSLLALDELADLQIVATTHSPYVLDELDASEIYAFALRDDGTVTSKRLSEHPDASRTRGSLKAGQLWSLDPERNWVLRG
jgi:predicted ATPase